MGIIHVRRTRMQNLGHHRLQWYVLQSQLPPIYIHDCADTTGLQSSSATALQDGRFSFTCTFATGATSTGCQITLVTGMGNAFYSTNVTRRNGDEGVSAELGL